MKRHKVESSNIAEVGYDPQAETLEILFKNGGLYQYPDIQPIQFAWFMDAGSMGGYFGLHFRKLPFEKVIPAVTISPE